MFLVVTRNFPPDVGGMQVLMGGLSENLLNHGPVKVFTFEHPKIIIANKTQLLICNNTCLLLQNFIIFIYI